MANRSVVLKMELDFEHEEELIDALESFSIILKNWDNHYKDNPKNKIKYYVSNEG